MPTINHIVRPHESDLRLDVLFRRILTTEVVSHKLSRTAISKLIRAEKVLLNGLPVKPTHTLKTGDAITGSVADETVYPQLIPNHNISLPILFENDAFIVINKPAGILTHPVHSHQDKSVAHWFIANYPLTASVGEDPLRPGIVHRLDQDTSGLLVLAKTLDAFFAFKSLFKQHLIRKTYTALVYGHLRPSSGIITFPIARAVRGNRQTIAHSSLPSKGPIRNALTEYKVIQKFPLYELVEAYPQTGRTHQIRLHFYALKHPVIGDRLYFFRDYDKKLQQ